MGTPFKAQVYIPQNEMDPLGFAQVQVWEALKGPVGHRNLMGVSKDEAHYSPIWAPGATAPLRLTYYTPNIPLVGALCSLLDSIWGLLKGSLGVLGYGM